MRRRKIDTENLGENTPISLRLPKKVLEWIQTFCETHPEYTGRNHFIDIACRYYLNLEPCPNCGKLNPRDANVCAYCTTELQGMQDMLEEIQSHVLEYEEIHSIGCEVADTITALLNDIQEYINSLDVATREKIKLEVSGFGHRCRLRVDFPNKYFTSYREKSLINNSFNFTRNEELIIPDYPAVINTIAESLNKEHDALKTISSVDKTFETAVLAGLYYYNTGKRMLNGDNFSLKEIDNLSTGIEMSIKFAIDYSNALKESYDDLLIYQKMVKLLAEKQT